MNLNTQSIEANSKRFTFFLHHSAHIDAKFIHFFLVFLPHIFVFILT